jgi:hypothetical protein
MQLQHRQKWRRRFEQDPYKALFGASEDMLNGKGLKSWQSLVRWKCPKWLIDELGLGKLGDEKDYRG